MATTMKIQTPILKPVAWKGRTLYQITSSIRRNRNLNEKLPLYFLPNPITKQYRRELITDPTLQNSCNQRISLSIRELDAPNGSIVVQTKTQSQHNGGIISTIDPLFPNNTGLLGTLDCNTCNNNADNCLTSTTTKDNVCFTQQTDARRRCRSGGMIARKFQSNGNNDNQYFTNSNQYLTSRNRKFSQNQYAYIRQGDAAAKPGSAAAQSNVYSPAGLSHCPKYIISATKQNNTFQYIWLDGATFTATIPDGNYDVNDLNNAFRNIQTNNLHYFTNKTNLSHAFLLGFSYNTVRGVIELNAYASLTPNTTIYTPASVWVETQTVPQIVFAVNDLTTALGFTAGNSYPATNGETTNQIFYGMKTGQFVPPYVALYYKPSNSQYAQQGGVSSSEKVARLKYNTVQSTARLAGVWGQSTANALAYGVPVPDYPNTIKEKRGFPMTQTPIIRVYDNGLGIDKCDKYITRVG